MRRKGFVERQHETDTRTKEKIARRQWATVIGVCAIAGTAITFFYLAMAWSLGVIG